MVIAQSMGEYGAAGGRLMANAMDAGLRAFSTIADSVENAEPTTWLALGGACLIMWFAFRR